MKRSLLVAALLVCAGCGAPFGSSGTPTPTHDPTATATPSPTVSPVPDDPAENAVPGVSDGYLRNVSALLSAHTEGLVRSGFVVVSVGNATVRRSGILVRANVRGRNAVEPDATTYRFWNVTRAGPVTRRVEGYGNGTVEFRRRGNGDFLRRQPQTDRQLAGVWVLVTHLRAGNYTVTDVTESANATRYVLEAATVENASAVRKALPAGATNASDYRARLVVDGEGRIHALSVGVNYTIGGRRTTLRVRYRLERLGGVSVTRPDWVATAVNRTG